MKRFLISIVLASAMFSVGAMAQSSKFSAMWETDGVFLAGAFDVYYTDDGEVTDDASGNTGLGFEDTMAMIKAPQGKELLIGVSGVAGLVTFTEAKGKNKAGPSTSAALAGIGMYVAYMPADEVISNVCLEGEMAAPGVVPLSIRYQTLSVTTDLDVVDADAENCTDPVLDNGVLEEGQCLADLLEIEGSVTVALGLATAAAHHFNFIAADLPRSTTYKVAACFVGGALAEVVEGEGAALALVGIGKRMVTVQEVRAVKGAFDME
jgi:hypothetical protein